jgi:SAM-dependent methyltransferase
VALQAQFPPRAADATPTAGGWERRPENLNPDPFEAHPSGMGDALCSEMFQRADESDDSIFYSTDRILQPLDDQALNTVTELIGRIVPRDFPAILDLMASHDSHLPTNLLPLEVTGLGLNPRELDANAALTERVVHDVNREPKLPLDDEIYDAALCTVSVDYLTKPVAVFREVARVLKPGGVFLVIFSNRSLPQKVVQIWREMSEDDRAKLVTDYFDRAGVFAETTVFKSRGRPRLDADRYSGLMKASDPVYAVFAQTAGKKTIEVAALPDAVVVAARTQRVSHTLECPYCVSGLRKWEVPQHVWAEWPNDYFHVCFNDDCPYFVRGWNTMERQGASGSYRLMYDDLRDACGPIPVLTDSMLRDGIIG